MVRNSRNEIRFENFAKHFFANFRQNRELFLALSINVFPLINPTLPIFPFDPPENIIRSYGHM